MNRLLAVFVLSLFAALPVCFADALSTIAITDVTQRWPWNNKVDISYTVTGGQDLAVSNFCKIVFTAVIAGKTYVIDGTKDVGASANPGSHTVTWQLPDGVFSTDSTMSAALYQSDAPSGDDYMIVDLGTGEVTFEGSLATPTETNARYNSDLYKSTNAAGRCCMVLRKIPAGGPYPTGDNTNYSTKNGSKTWKTDRDYYIGVFPVTQYQYTKLGLSNPSSHKTSIAGENTLQCPVEMVLWNEIRHGGGTAQSPNAAIPRTTVLNEGGFLQRLRFKTAHRYAFDLPTVLMSEVATRAGAATVYPWGPGNVVQNDWLKYVVSKDNSAGRTWPVGSKEPNPWGLYDTMGNVNEWCLDGGEYANFKNAPDIFTPGDHTSAADKQRYRRGGHFNMSLSEAGFRASSRSLQSAGDHLNWIGFRVAVVMP
jgi:formylglycine-generating enzyme required for sulfatase activity